MKIIMFTQLMIPMNKVNLMIKLNGESTTDILAYSI
jgi:hypothetical protein